MSRGVWHPLEQGECESSWRFVQAIAADPDYEAPIYYTQAKKQQAAVIYIDSAPSKPQSTKSIFKTNFLDPLTGEKQEAVVTIGYEAFGTEIKLRLEASPETIAVALSNHEWLVEDKEDVVVSSIDDLKSAAAEQGAVMESMSSDQVILASDREWLPDSFGSSAVLLFKGRGKPLDLAIPVQLREGHSIAARPAVVMVIDGKGDLIGTGAYSLLVPAN